MNFSFYMPVQVVGGRGAVQKGAGAVAALGQSAFVVTGKHSAKLSGALADVTVMLEKAGIAYQIFDGVTENPLLSQCMAAGRAAREMKAKFLVAIGGGSVLDAAKAAAIFAANPDLDQDTVYSLAYKIQPLPLVAVGITSGTGSEVSPYAVLTVDKTGKKRSISHPCCYPRIALADPKYTESLGFDGTVTTGLDALSHTLEGALSPRCTDCTLVFVRRALELLVPALQELARGGETVKISAELHEKLFTGSLYAGMVLNECSTAFPHPLGYPLTERFCVPHGQACALFLPALLERGEAFEPKRTRLIYQYAGLTRQVFCELLLALKKVPPIHLNKTLLEDCRTRWQDVKNFKNSPGGFTTQEALALFEKTFAL